MGGDWEGVQVLNFLNFAVKSLLFGENSLCESQIYEVVVIDLGLVPKKQFFDASPQMSAWEPDRKVKLLKICFKVA